MTKNEMLEQFFEGIEVPQSVIDQQKRFENAKQKEMFFDIPVYMFSEREGSVRIYVTEEGLEAAPDIKSSYYKDAVIKFANMLLDAAGYDRSKDGYY